MSKEAVIRHIEGTMGMKDHRTLPAWLMRHHYQSVPPGKKANPSGRPELEILSREAKNLDY